MKKIKKSGIITKFIVSFVMIVLIFGGFNYNNKITYAGISGSYNQTLKCGIDSFPETYKQLLNDFVDETGHDNWTFYAYYTGIDWADFIGAEAQCGRNRIYQGFDTAYRCSCNNVESSYYCADSDITAYFIDPRNFINERNIFQFLEISYNEDIHTKEVIDNMISSYGVFNYGNPITFVMSDTNSADYGKSLTMTYADIIIAAAKASQMSPISIVTKIKQEVGASGSGSTSGTNSTYPNTYNFFNIGSYDSGDAILNGLKYADKCGWHDPYTSIVEGAKYNSDSYIKAGQNTSYFYKFDCVGNTILQMGRDGANGNQTITSTNLFHQYMTNVYDPYTQSATLFSTYTNNDLLDEKLSFIIPVYDNMPSISAQKPSTLLSSSNQNLYFADITSTAYTRTGAGTGYSVVKVDYTNSSGKQVSESLMLYKGDLVIMLDKECSTNNGYVWDKVQFWNGKIGYVPDMFLSKYNYVEEEIIPKPEPVSPSRTIVGYGYANVSSSLNLRAGAGSSYRVIDSLSPNEEFYIAEILDSWYKVETLDGLEGYVSREYAESILYANKQNDEIKIIPKATAKMIATYLGVTEYTVKKGDSVVTDETLGTGYTFTTEADTYTIVKTGDVNGDGKVNTGDAYLVQKYVVGLKTLTDEFLDAVDINHDGKFNTGDAYLIQKYVVGLKSIQV